MNASLLWPFFIVGLSTGGLYALLGAGNVLAYRASGYLHIANAGIAMVSALVYIVVLRNSSLLLAVPVGLVVGPLLAGLLYRGVFRRLEKSTMAAKVVLSVAVGIGLQAVGGMLLINFNLLQGGRASSAMFAEDKRLEFFGVSITHQQAALPVVALFVVATIHWALHHTDLGLALRVSSQNPMSAELAGVPAAKVTLFTWAASGLIVAIAGILSVSASSFLIPTYLFAENIRGLAASLTGGFVDLRRMALAAFALGILENELVGFSAPWNGLRGAVSFALITVVALFGLGRVTTGGRPELAT